MGELRGHHPLLLSLPLPLSLPFPLLLPLSLPLPLPIPPWLLPHHVSLPSSPQHPKVSPSRAAGALRQGSNPLLLVFSTMDISIASPAETIKPPALSKQQGALTILGPLE